MGCCQSVAHVKPPSQTKGEADISFKSVDSNQSSESENDNENKISVHSSHEQKVLVNYKSKSSFLDCLKKKERAMQYQ